jgi:septum site-determining protein MinC
MIVPTRQSLMFRARSYMAFVLSPQPPIENWLADLDASIEHAKGLFAHHPVALDLSATDLDAKGIASLVTSLNERHIRVQTEFLSDCAASHDVIRKEHCRAA